RMVTSAGRHGRRSTRAAAARARIARTPRSRRSDRIFMIIPAGKRQAEGYTPPATMRDKLNEECGVFGVFGAAEAANLTYLGLHALQHRGQEAAGIVSSDGIHLHIQKDLGLVQDVFDVERLKKLPGESAIGHVRYGTAGGGGIKNAQPFAVDYGNQPIAVAHNGHLVNAEAIRRDLEKEGAIFFSSSDTEVVLHLIARESGEPADRIAAALQHVEGAFSFLFLTEKQLIGVRDPRGFRPLVLGRLKKG